MILIFLFCLGQLHLTWVYLRRKKIRSINQAPKEFPVVTIQLPVYNEYHVAGRLIDSVSGIKYPIDRLEVQVLDDSDDETTRLISEKTNALQQAGLNIQHIRRPSRSGFKAGALQYGLERAKGELIAVFDADFMPGEDFLKDTVAEFADPDVGLVQTRWGHINRDYSILTKLQAFGLDGHFTIEQTGRSNAGSFINFNGTGGIWRKTCIIDSGGWSAETLTEDLDLSYRAQLKGWKFKYKEDIVSPAELPIVMQAIKTQQFRWNKGAAETARKHAGNVLRSDLSAINKIHSVFHLFNSTVFLLILIASLLSVPMMYLKNGIPEYELLFNLGSIFILGFAGIGFFYWVSVKRLSTSHQVRNYLKTFPAFLTVYMGLSLHNGIAVLEGLTGIRTPFIRTPKFGIRKPGQSWKGNKYFRPKFSVMSVFEGLFSLYFIFGIWTAWKLNDFGLVIFHLMLAIGFAMVFLYSIKPLAHGRE